MLLVLFVFISLIFCFFLANLPSLTLIFAALWGATLVISALYLVKRDLIFLLILNLGVLYFLAGASSLFFYFFFFGIAAIVMSLLLLKNMGYYDLQKWGIISAVLGVSVFLGVIYFSTGNIGINQFEHQLQAYMAESINHYEELGMLDFYEKRGIVKTELEANMYGLASKIAKHLPAFYYLQAILVVFFMLLIAVWVSLKRNILRLKKRPYSQEIMPWQLAWLAIAGLILWLVGRENMSLIYFAGSNILLILVPITMYYGLSAITYKFKQRKLQRRKWLILIIVVLCVVFPLSAVIFLSIIGLFDALIDYRKLRIEK